MKVLVVVEDDMDMRLLIELTLAADPRLSVSGKCATARDAIATAHDMQPDLVILDHFIDGDVMGMQAAPSIKAVAPDALILLFTSHDLRFESSREPAIDRFLLKRDISKLTGTVQEMLRLAPRAA